MNAQRYEVNCSRCYSVTVGRSNSKREANRMATSHLNLYQHDVTITDTKRKIQTLDLREVRV